MIELDSLFLEGASALCLSRCKRSHPEFAILSLTLDGFDQAACLFIRVPASHDAAFRLGGDFRLVRCHAGGWLLVNRAAGRADYWLPAQATLRRLDGQGHILEERLAEWSSFDLDTSGIGIVFAPPPPGWVLDAPIWRLGDRALTLELESLTAPETQGYFLLGSHTRYGKPADLYRHLIHGWVYEDRYAWPHKRRICSENDAHALHLIFSGLARATGKRIYEILKGQLLLSILSRESDDGGFRHGEWTDGMESHFRLHCSAMHLMMDALSERDDPTVRVALARAMHFISDKRDATDIGVWFFHDELECSEAGMVRAPFKWWPSRALGKSPQNMLVLNTQLDTLVALDRYQMLTGDGQYAELVDSGFRAAQALLARRPMEWLYRLVFSAINLTLLPTEQAQSLPAWRRLWKRIGWQFFAPRLPRLKTRYPRLTMPGGYIDREVSLQVWAFDYLAVNLMDLVRAGRGARHDAFSPYIEGILRCYATTGLAQHCLEHKGRAYAVGFLAEALYLLCLREPRADLDAALAECLLLCARHGLGLPPSLLNGNAEAQPAYGVRATPQPARVDVLVADLTTPANAACLVVNAGEAAIALRDALLAAPGWTIPDGELVPGQWTRLVA